MKEQTQQTIEVDPIKEATGANAFEWFQAWMPLLLVIIPIWWAWKQARMAQDRRNAERLDRYRKEGREHEYSDMTVMQWARNEMTKSKDK